MLTEIRKRFRAFRDSKEAQGRASGDSDPWTEEPLSLSLEPGEGSITDTTMAISPVYNSSILSSGTGSGELWPTTSGYWKFPNPPGYEELARQLSAKAYETAYEDAIKFLVDVVSRFGACACEVSHASDCAWHGNLKDIQTHLRDAMTTAKVAGRLTK